MGWGSSTRRGGGQKLRAPPRSLSSLVSKRGIWDVLAILPGSPGPLGVFKKFVLKKFVRIFRSLTLEELSGSLVHTNFAGKGMDQWLVHMNFS